MEHAARNDKTTEPIGALHQWHAELHAGYCEQSPSAPSTWRYDALYRAACVEASGLEAARDARLLAASWYFARSAEIIRRAARAKQRVA